MVFEKRYFNILLILAMNLSTGIKKRSLTLRKERTCNPIVPRRIFHSVCAPRNLQFIDYLEAYPPYEKGSDEIIRQMKNYQENFHVLQKDFCKLMEREIMKLHKTSKMIISKYLDNKVIFALTKYRKVSLKYHRAVHDYYANASSKLSQFEVFLNTSIKNMNLFKIKYDAFLQTLKSKEVTNKHVQLQFKKKALRGYCKHHKNQYRIPMVRTEQLIQSLQSVNKLIDLKKRYVPLSKFDDCLYFYCIRNNLILWFQQIVSKMPQYPAITSPHILPNAPKVSHTCSDSMIPGTQTHSPHDDSPSCNRPACTPIMISAEKETNFVFEIFDTFILKFFSILAEHFAENQSLFLALRCASIRILFDMYYVKNNNIFSVNEDQKEFIQECTKIIGLTPSDMKITEKIICESNYHKTFREIFDENPCFTIASQQMFMSQFLINPIGMANMICRSIENVEKGIRKLHNESMEEIIEISFDDIFTMLIPVYANMPITCTNSFDRVLKIFSQLKLSISLDYGIISIASIIEQIKKMITPS